MKILAFKYLLLYVRYGTAGAHTIIRQHLDYGHWYCRNKLTLKDIHNTQARKPFI